MTSCYTCIVLKNIMEVKKLQSQLEETQSVLRDKDEQISVLKIQIKYLKQALMEKHEETVEEVQVSHKKKKGCLFHFPL